MADRRGLAPHAAGGRTICFRNSPGTLVWLTIREIGDPGGNRTHNLPLKRRLLSLLSYEAIV